MKKISIILLLMFGIFTTSIAQTTSPQAITTVSKQDKAAKAAQKKADKEAKALAKLKAKDAKASASNQTTFGQNKAALAAQKKTAKEAKALAKLKAKDAKVSSGNQTTAVQNAASIAAQKKADKEAKALAKKQAKETKVASAPPLTAARMNKNGTPDKRFNVNKQPKAITQVAPQVQPTQSVQVKNSAKPVKVNKSRVVRTSTVKTADKVISTDAKGRSIYQGSRGGKYYIDKNGNKEYIK